MTKSQKITYKVFLFERVKKKIPFLNTATYPVQIRLTAGQRTIYLKSHFFSMMQMNKYQEELPGNMEKIVLKNIIDLEEELMEYILQRKNVAASLDAVRSEYHFLCQDILHVLDEPFKQFLVDFFFAENLPAWSTFIKNDGGNHRSEFILHDLEKSLQPAVIHKLKQMAVEKAPPYIPCMQFYRKKMLHPLPLFPVYYWQQDTIAAEFSAFIHEEFPEYLAHNPAAYINRMVDTSPFRNAAHKTAGPVQFTNGENK